ncbi:MAG TPA: DinB family protein [Pseudolabrys sp.]|nr:DinB family protein [Pseudolabrys sp.]
MKERYRMFAGYNSWCNERLYDAASKVPDADYRADRGAFFKSLHGTLNHLLVGDRIWMKRFTGVGSLPESLDAILYDNFEVLRAARRTQDVLIARYIAGLDNEVLSGTIRYKTFVKPRTIEQPLAPALDHFFNHQAHHRGQAHALLSSMLGNYLTPSFDLIIYQRETGQGGIRKIE